MIRNFILVIIFICLLIAGCQTIKTTDESQQINPNVSNAEPILIRIVVLPLIDTLPIYVAEQEGIFSNHGLIVEFIPVASAPERDQILQAGQADATVNEILSDMFFNKNGIQMQVVRYAHMASPKTAHFFILASANSGFQKVDDLKNVPIGISEGTIIEYVTDRLLQANGFSSDEINTLAVPKMPDRMALLASGELKAGVLPDPLAALSVQQGAVIILDDSQYPGFGASVISFSKKFIDQNPAAVKEFLAAIEEATAKINLHSEQYANLLSEKQLVPDALISNYEIPAFPMAGITSEAEWNDALAWAMEKGLLTEIVPFADSVNATFLP